MKFTLNAALTIEREVLTGALGGAWLTLSQAVAGRAGVARIIQRLAWLAEVRALRPWAQGLWAQGLWAQGPWVRGPWAAPVQSGRLRLARIVWRRWGRRRLTVAWRMSAQGVARCEVLR
ncbi:MAG: hypothetical protein ACK4IT_08035 [Thioalkalivibrionaceae bacterium]